MPRDDRLNSRLPDDMLAAIDERASTAGLTKAGQPNRSAVVKCLIEWGLATCPLDWRVGEAQSITVDTRDQLVIVRRLLPVDTTDEVAQTA